MAEKIIGTMSNEEVISFITTAAELECMSVAGGAKIQLSAPKIRANNSGVDWNISVEFEDENTGILLGNSLSTGLLSRWKGCFGSIEHLF